MLFLWCILEEHSWSTFIHPQESNFTKVSFGNMQNYTACTRVIVGHSSTVIAWPFTQNSKVHTFWKCSCRLEIFHYERNSMLLYNGRCKTPTGTICTNAWIRCSFIWTLQLSESMIPMSCKINQSLLTNHFILFAGITLETPRYISPLIMDSHKVFDSSCMCFHLFWT